MRAYLKWVFLGVLIIISICGFMIKLPLQLRGIDLELHALFYFVASACLNLLFKVKDFKTHMLIFGLLVTAGVVIEFAQEYSNQLFNQRIHGNFDKVDVLYNLIGLFGFTCFWLSFKLIVTLKKRHK
jgi:ABC-type multidrug transport system permease subunit